MGEDDMELERQLEEQVAENRSSLAAIEEALLEEHSAELVEMQEELRQAVKIAEQGLLNLKRSRLLRQIGIMESADGNPQTESLYENTPSGNQFSESCVEIPNYAPYLKGNSDIASDVIVEFVDPVNGRVHDSAKAVKDGDWPLDSMCRFRHRDGRWYTGVVIASDRAEDPNQSGVGEVVVKFAHPTRESMKVCRFYLEDRCDFGDSCRFSHGHRVPSASLNPYTAVDPTTLPLGSLVWVAVGASGLWQQAELEAKDVDCFSVALTYNGKRAQVGPNDIVALKYGDESEVEGHAYTYEVQGGREREDMEAGEGGEEGAEWEDEEEGDDSEEDDDEEEEEGVGGVGGEGREWGGLGLGSFPEAQEMLRAGIQTETVNFAEWERHTRGMASKMMASMGFKEGMGLGVRGQGIVAPIEVRRDVKKAEGGEYVKKGGGVGAGGVVVGVARGEVEGEGGKKKRKARGGERRRRQKFAAALRKSKEGNDDEFAPDLFSFINGQLSKSVGSKTEGVGVSKAGAKEGQDGGRGKKGKSAPAPFVDRRALLAREDELQDLVSRIGKLEEMAGRNKNDKNVYTQVQRKLGEAKAALAKAKGAHAIAHQDMYRKEQNKKLMKF